MCVACARAGCANCFAVRTGEETASPDSEAFSNSCSCAWRSLTSLSPTSPDCVALAAPVTRWYRAHKPCSTLVPACAVCCSFSNRTKEPALPVRVRLS